ncbi:hypothetical protein KR093_005113, partial [Drosophila rubida]
RFSNSRNPKMAALPTTYDAKDNTWSGAKIESVYNYDTSAGRIILSTMKNWPSIVIQINDIDGVAVTNGQAITWAIRIAQHLKKRGLKSTDVIGIAARNTTYLMPLGVACLLNTTPFHAVNPALDEDTIKYVFNITKPKLIFCDGLDYAKIKAATRTWKPEIFTMVDHMDDVPTIESLLDPTTTEMFYKPEPLKLGGDQTVAILCSSGTTGLPKAVCMSNHILIQESMLVSSESILYTPSSLDWITGLWGFAFCTFSNCTRIITNKPFNPEYFVQLVKKYKINFVVVPPRHLSALLNCPTATTEALSSIRMLNYGGGLVSLTTLQRAQELCKSAMLNSGYAMTEVGAIAGNIGISNNNAAGRLLPGVKVQIVDEEGKRLGYNQVGEIYVHTGHGWNGYYGNPVETQKIHDHKGWFHTGDLGYFDNQNYLYIVDRKKEIMKYQGLHYWPTEIENVIVELPEVQEVCVVGIYDEKQGDAAGALVVKRQGCQISEKAIIDHVAKRFKGVQMQLHAGVRFTDKLPVNVNDKTLRRIAREQFVAQNGAR